MNVEGLGALGAELNAFVSFNEEIVKEVFVNEVLDPGNKPLGEFLPGEFFGDYLVYMDAVFRM